MDFATKVDRLATAVAAASAIVMLRVLLAEGFLGMAHRRLAVQGRNGAGGVRFRIQAGLRLHCAGRRNLSPPRQFRNHRAKGPVPPAPGRQPAEKEP